MPLPVAKSTTEAMMALYDRDSDLLAWWGTDTGCASAIARLERTGGLAADAAVEVFERLRLLAESWHEIQPVVAVREAARRMLRVHPSHAAAAVQLAAAVVASERDLRARLRLPRSAARQAPQRGGFRIDGFSYPA